MEHTKTPWKIEGNEIVTENGSIAEVNNPANAAFIVKAVNCHEEMLKALKAVIIVFELHPEIAEAVNKANPLTVESCIESIHYAE